MRDPLRNIEDFIREKLSFLDNSYPNDWDAFERKLQRAIFFKRLKIFTSLGVVTLLLFWANQNFTLPLQDYDMPRDPVTQNQAPITISPNPVTPLLRESQPVVRIHPSEKNKRVLSSAGAAGARKSKANHLSPRPGNSTATVSPEKSSPSVAREEVSPIGNLDHRKLNIENRSHHPVRAPTALKTLSMSEQALPAVALNLPKKFLEMRRPDYSVFEVKEYQPYISPLQEQSPWSYTVNVYPNFTFRKFQVDPEKESMMHSDFIDEMKNNEKSGFSLNIGLEISRRIGAVTYLNSGVEYITNTYKADFNFTNFREANIDARTGEITGYQWKVDEEQIVFSDDNQFHYLNFPLSISYQPWATDHLRLNLEAGASLLYFVQASGTTIDHRTLEVIDLEDQSYRKYMGSFGLKIGMQYYVTPKINIGFEPTLMYFTNTIYTEEYPFYVIPYSVGVNFNVQVKLN